MTVKISNFQLASLFIMTRMFSDCLNFPLSVSNYGMQRFSVMFISYAVLFILYIPAIILSQKFKSESIFSIFAARCRPLLYITAIPFIILMFYQSTLTGLSLEFFTSNTIMNTMSHFLAVLLFTVVAIYGVSKGISATMRISPLILIAFLIAVTISFISYFDKINFYYLYPAFVDNAETFWDEVRLELSKNSQLFVFLVLCRFTDKKASRGVFIYIPFVILLSFFMFAFCMMVLGPGLNITSFPYNRLATLVDLVVLERLDGLDMFIWIFTGVLKIIMFMLTVRNILVFIVKERSAKIMTCVLTALSGMLSYYFALRHHILMVLDLSWAIIGSMVIFGVICPIIAIILNRKKEDGHAKINNNTIGYPAS